MAEALDAGAEVVLTSFGRAKTLTRRWGRVDGALHAVGFAPQACLGQPEGIMAADWGDVATAFEVSAYSLKGLAASLAPLMPAGAAIVALDSDAAQVWPAYDWMGVAKAALEATARYLAHDLGPQGIRVNLVSAGPLRTMAARSIPGFAEIAAPPRRSLDQTSLRSPVPVVGA